MHQMLKTKVSVTLCTLDGRSKAVPCEVAHRPPAPPSSSCHQARGHLCFLEPARVSLQYGAKKHRVPFAFLWRRRHCSPARSVWAPAAQLWKREVDGLLLVPHTCLGHQLDYCAPSPSM